MEDIDHRENGIVFSKSVRAGKRTYFFDVRLSKNGEKYLVIAESKKKIDPETGEFQFEKHKLFLYNEDFENFTNAFTDTINFIKTGIVADDSNINPIDISAEDLTI
jgi:hypothetical protein